MITEARGKLRAALPLLADLVVPTVLYFLLVRLGLDQIWALSLAGAATAVTALVNTVRRRRLDGVGVLVVAEIVLSVGLLFVVDDPRLVLAKPACYTALTGAWLLVTCFVGRPFIYQAATPMAVRGDSDRAVAYERAWERSARFRHLERRLTATLALVLFVESVLRVGVVYHFPADEIGRALLISQVPGVVLIVAFLIFTRLHVPALQRIVAAELRQLSSERVPA